VLSHPGSARIQVSLPARSILDGLAALTGEPPQQRPELAPSLDLSAGHGRSLASYILMAALDLDRPDSVLIHSRAMQQFEQLIVTTLLLSHEHTHSEHLRRCARSIAPKDVKRALDYIESNLAAPLSLADLVVASGVPGRTLLKHFRDTKGISPMRHLRNARFARVREALLAARDEDRVTEIALACGFSHMGRFSVEYRRRFGESPSETLKQRRAPRCS
jgi:transcriptional regulator GlxA family with amidase domain